MKNIRWGIIGCGDVTEVKSGPGFQKAENSTLVAVMRRNGELAKDYARRHGVPKWYDNADELINDPEVDVVYVATPPAYHKEYTLKAALAGKPVYVEKPMAVNFQEAVEMVEACKEARVRLYIAYYRRRLPRFIKVKELIENGQIGEVRFVNIKLYQTAAKEELNAETLPWRVIPEISGGGKFLDLASHTLDVLDYILGPIKDASGYFSNQAGLYKAEDIVTASFNFSNGIQGTGTWCFSAYDRYDMNEIVGSKGKILFSSFGTEPVELINNDGKVLFPEETPLHVQQPLIQTIVNELNGFGKCPSTGDSAIRTTYIMDKILNKLK
jgi:predicted dehydrogenase